MRKSLIAGVTLCAAAAAQGQNIDMAHMIGQPLQYMKDGELDGCGLRIVALLPMQGNRVEISEMSVNVYVAGVAMVKAVAYAPVPLPVGSTPRREVKVVSSWIKAPGAKAASPAATAVPGESKLSLLHLAEPWAAFAVLMAQQEGKQIQLAVRREGKSPERILAGEVKLESGEAVQLSQCLTELLTAMQARAEKK